MRVWFIATKAGSFLARPFTHVRKQSPVDSYIYSEHFRLTQTSVFSYSYGPISLKLKPHDYRRTKKAPTTGSLVLPSPVESVKQLRPHGSAAIAMALTCLFLQATPSWNDLSLAIFCCGLCVEWLLDSSAVTFDGYALCFHVYESCSLYGIFPC